MVRCKPHPSFASPAQLALVLAKRTYLRSSHLILSFFLFISGQKTRRSLFLIRSPDSLDLSDCVCVHVHDPCPTHLRTTCRDNQTSDSQERRPEGLENKHQWCSTINAACSVSRTQSESSNSLRYHRLCRFMFNLSESSIAGRILCKTSFLLWTVIWFFILAFDNVFK